MSAAGLINNAIPQLVIPPPSIARHPETIVKPRELKSWLADLPVTDTRQQAEQLHRQLKLLIRDPKSGPQYAELLRLYHPLLQGLQEQVWTNLCVSGHGPATEDQLQTTVSQLLLEISCGHMRLINESITAGKQPAAENIYHAMLPLCRLLHWDLLQYNLVRPSIWRQVLQLFAIGELYALNGQQQSSSFHLPEDARTSHGVFFSTLVTLLCDPYRLPASQLAQLIKGLGKASEHLRVNTSGEANYRVAVDLSGRLPPLRYARLQQQQQQNEQYLQLDEFFIQFDRLGLPGDSIRLVQWLIGSLRDLALKPKGREARRHIRIKREANYHFVHGLEKVHERLTEIQQGTQKPQAQDNASAGIVIGGTSQNVSVELGTPCRQLDYSESGAGFMLGTNAQAPTVGCLVLMESDQPGGNATNRWFAGTVRRRLKFDHQGTEIGVEKLQGNIVPVTFGLDQKPGLLQVQREQHVFRLVAPPNTFTGPGEQTLKGPENEINVIFEELLDNNTADIIRVSLV